MVFANNQLIKFYEMENRKYIKNILFVKYKM